MMLRIFSKLTLGLCAMIALTLLAAGLLTSPTARRTYQDSLWRQMEDKARLLAQEGAGLESPARVAALARAANIRITVVARDGRVVADSSANAGEMENHGGRPEVVAALGGGVGRDVRKSATFGTNYLYVAVPAEAGVLRVAVPESVLDAQVAAVRWSLIRSTALAFVPVVLLALYLARRTSFQLGNIIAYARELANGNFHTRLPNEDPGELGLLSRKLNETSSKLERTVQQLQTEHAELEKVERVRKDFVINVSHELRTPLASIQGYTETLMDGALHDEANNMRFLTIIRHNAERLARLTEDLLTLSRIEMKSQEFRFASYRINELLRDILDTLRPIADKKSISLQQEVAPHGTEVFCDSEAVYQILSNLVDNAVKYTPERGRVVVGVKILPVNAGGRMLEVYVKDSGMGIPFEDQPRLFERFYRVDKARSRELGGTGLGLAIVKHLVRTHGGDVRVESALNQGATFFFTLPMESRMAAPEPTSSRVHNVVTGS